MNPKKNRRNYYAEEVSAIEAADFLRLPERTFYKLVEDGVIPKVDEGVYVLGDVVHAYWRSQFDSEGLLAAKTRLTTATAEIQELKLSQERGELVRSSAVMKVWCDNVLRAKTKLLSLPAKISPELLGQELNVIELKLANEIDEALKELAAYNVEQVKRIEQ